MHLMPLDIVRLSDELLALDRYSELDVSVSVQIASDKLPIAAAVAQADNFGDRWYVSRVIIRSPEARGRGLGSLALQRMLAVIGRISDLPVWVCPGGYSDDSERQFRFYRKNGFRSVEDDPSSLVWNRPSEARSESERSATAPDQGPDRPFA